MKISTVVITTITDGDAPILRDQLAQIPPNQEIAPATTGGAYDTRRWHYSLV